MSILSTLVVLFIVLTIIVGIGTSGYKEKHLQLIFDSMNTFATEQKTQFQQFINNKVVLLQGLVHYPDIYNMNPDEQVEFIKGHSKQFGFHHMFVIKKNGMSYYYDENKCINQKNDPFYYDVMNNDVYVSEPYYTGQGSITTISVSIYHNNTKQGVLCGAVELNDIANMFSDKQIFMQGKLLLINRSGQYISAADENRVNNQITIYEEDESEVSLIKEAFFDKSDKFGTIILDGTNYIANITYLPNYDWVIIQCIEEKNIYKELNYFDIWRNGSVGIIFFIVLSVIKIIVNWQQSMQKINTDPLTKCRSRISMLHLLDTLEHDYQKDITVIYFDLNKFKQVNDTYGHDEGDRILCLFASTLTSVFYKHGQIGRLGGDEFIAVAVNVSKEKILELCNNVEIQLKRKGQELNLPYEVSTSYGYATREKGNKALLSDIMKQADDNMYKYKKGVHEKDKIDCWT